VIDETLLEAEEKMEKAVSVAKEDFGNIRTGRITPSVFSKLTVDYYGAPTPVNQLASFHIPEPRMVIITPYDKSTLGAVERAIRDSDLGVNPGNDGTIIRCVFPELSEQRRRDLVKVARTKAEEAKVSIRNVRRHAKDAIESIVRDGEAGEDEGRRAEKDLDEATHRYTGQVDELLKHKESELLSV
jgi:ribosome recycling factor